MPTTSAKNKKSFARRSKKTKKERRANDSQKLEKKSSKPFWGRQEKNHPRISIRSTSKSKASPRTPEHPLENQILSLLKNEALLTKELVTALHLQPREEPLVKKVIDQLIRKELVVRIRENRYVIPETADLMIGTLQVHRNGGAHILSEKKSMADLYIASDNLGTALHGDEVMARLIRDRRSDRYSLAKERRASSSGSIVRILKRATQSIVGTLQRSKNFYYVVADDPRFSHNLSVPAPEAKLSARAGDKVVASFDSWENRHTNPEGTVIEVLGAADAPGVDMLSIIRKHQLPAEFSASVLKEATAYGTSIHPKDIEGREDLRDRMIVTIDPDDARDFDDAIEVEETASGWAASIHIADVAHYVKPNSLLDKEARNRGNSTYLVDRVIPMLPESLSNGLCSLRPDEDRLAFSVFATIDRKGTVQKVRFARTVIRSMQRLSYQQALKILQKPPQSKIEHRIHTAWNCSSALRRRRMSLGALDLEMPEIKVRLDAEGTPIKLERVENDISHQLIEELMLLANEQVARHLTRHQQPNLYRVHENPEPEKLEEYRDLARSYGVKAGNLTQRNEIQKLLNGLKKKPYEIALKIGLLKSLKRARYYHEPLGHYGLQKKDYTHFTSPIRRYADLVTHRALARQLKLTSSGPSSKELLPLGEHLSLTERTAGDAEKESVRLKKLDYLEAQQHTRKEHSFQAQIIEARNYGLLIELPEILLSGLVPVSLIKDDFYIFDAVRSRLIGQRTKKVYAAGDIISVAVAKVDRFKQQVDFQIMPSRKR